MRQKIEFLKRMLQAKVRDEKGATMVEYALMAALIAVICVAAVGDIGTRADATFDRVVNAMPAP